MMPLTVCSLVYFFLLLVLLSLAAFFRCCRRRLLLLLLLWSVMLSSLFSFRNSNCAIFVFAVITLNLVRSQTVAVVDVVLVLWTERDHRTWATRRRSVYRNNWQIGQ